MSDTEQQCRHHWYKEGWCMCPCERCNLPTDDRVHDSTKSE